MRLLRPVACGVISLIQNGIPEFQTTEVNDVNMLKGWYKIIS